MLCRKCLLKHVIEQTIEERIEVMERQKKDVSSYLMTLRKGGDIEN
jgi:hypothetical protein